MAIKAHNVINQYLNPNLTDFLLPLHQQST